jgi:hypothetical protein
MSPSRIVNIIAVRVAWQIDQRYQAMPKRYLPVIRGFRHYYVQPLSGETPLAKHQHFAPKVC